MPSYPDAWLIVSEMLIAEKEKMDFIKQGEINSSGEEKQKNI